MTDDLSERAVRTFRRHDAFERDGDEFRVTTTFDGRVTAAETDDRALSYSLTVRAPTLLAATEEKEEVGEAVEAGWYDTYERRLEDAPMAVRFDFNLEALGVTKEDDEVVAVFEFRWHNADQAPDIAKAMASLTALEADSHPVPSGTAD